MNKIDFLSNEEIEKYKKIYKNEEKFSSFKNVVNTSYLVEKTGIKNRVEAFEKVWNDAKHLVKRRYSFGRNDTNKSFNEITKMFVSEYVFYESSVLKNFENEEGKLLERFEKTEKKTYGDRTEALFEKYGDEIFYGKQFREYLQDYLDGKISKEELNDIIQEFKDTNNAFLENQGDESYKRNGFEINETIANEFSF